MNWREKEDLRSEISILRVITHWLETQRPDLTHEQVLKAIEKHKKRIREKRANIYKRDEEREIIIQYDKDGEGWITKEWYDFTFTDEEKKEYIEDHWQRINCAWDCTGLVFTRWISIFNVETSFGGRSVVYHAKGLDV